MRLSRLLIGLMALLGLVSLASAHSGPKWANNVVPTKSKFMKHLGKEAKQCIARMDKRRGPPLFPAHVELTQAQEDVFRDLVNHLWEIMVQIMRDSHWHHGGLYDYYREWKHIKKCTAHYRYIAQEDMISAFAALHEAAKELAVVTPKFPGEATMLLTDDLTMTALQLIGFLVDAFSETGLPTWLLDRPSDAIGGLLSYLSCDLTRPGGCSGMPDFHYVKGKWDMYWQRPRGWQGNSIP